MEETTLQYHLTICKSQTFEDVPAFEIFSKRVNIALSRNGPQRISKLQESVEMPPGKKKLKGFHTLRDKRRPYCFAAVAILPPGFMPLLDISSSS